MMLLGVYSQLVKARKFKREVEEWLKKEPNHEILLKIAPLAEALEKDKLDQWVNAFKRNKESAEQPDV